MMVNYGKQKIYEFKSMNFIRCYVMLSFIVFSFWKCFLINVFLQKHTAFATFLNENIAQEVG